MKVIPCDRHIYAFEPRMDPIVMIEAPETVVFETIDAMGGQVKSEKDKLVALDFSRINPATGPAFVKGAQPGDTLVVQIHGIDLPDQGAIVTGKGMGVLGDEMKAHATKILPIKDRHVHFDRIELPVSPMVGVMGVAPEKETFPTGTAHRHGGNMDTKEIGEGATVYLPVFQRGGMLAMGDVHAVMGDGEVCVAACEVSSRIAVEIDVVKGRQPKWPMVETNEGIYILVSLPTIEEALREVTQEAVAFLSEKLELPFQEAYMLASLAVDIRISQLVDPNKTAKAFIPNTLVGFDAFA